MKRFFILTDLEGPSGVDNFTQTRPRDGHPERVEASKKLLAGEVNACIEGIRSVYPDAHIDVWDGHGPGGLHAEDVVGGNYLRSGRPYKELNGFDGLLFVGQHAMAGTYNGPLCHTYSSLNIAYYKLNDVFIGEFAARALIAGMQGVPTIFLSGDDKAVLEAQMFVPNIETVAVKKGLGIEAAEHVPVEEAHRMIREGAARAVQRTAEIAPFTGIAPPYVLEMGFIQPRNEEQMNNVQDPDAEWVNNRTLRIRKESIMDFSL